MVFAGLRDTVGSVVDRQYGAIQLEDSDVHAGPEPWTLCWLRYGRIPAFPWRSG